MNGHGLTLLNSLSIYITCYFFNSDDDADRLYIQHLPHTRHCYKFFMSIITIRPWWTQWHMYWDPAFTVQKAETKESKLLTVAQSVSHKTEVKPAHLCPELPSWIIMVLMLKWNKNRKRWTQYLPTELERSHKKIPWPMLYPAFPYFSHHTFCEKRKSYLVWKRNPASQPGRLSGNCQNISFAHLRARSREAAWATRAPSEAFDKSSISGGLKFATNEWPPSFIDNFQAPCTHYKTPSWLGSLCHPNTVNTWLGCRSGGWLPLF